ncbi:MAG: hypothetical protein PUD02_00270 [Eggerthellales bacterium]|nr:hypothetical protein [Eggerthellales bacterium]
MAPPTASGFALLAATPSAGGSADHAATFVTHIQQCGLQLP